MKHYADQRRSEASTLKEGDKVYLTRRNIKTKRPSDKLDFKRLGPFLISRKLSDTNYELALPGKTQIHSRFHVFLLESASKNARLTQNFDIQDNREYEVEQILDHREDNHNAEYLIKWKGYDSSENTWESIHNIHAPKRIKEYWDRHHGRATVMSSRNSRRSPRKYWKDRE